MADLPFALSIAGSDCSAGAGLQADLKTFSALHVYGLTVVTSVVAESPLRVDRIDPMEASMVEAQLAILLEHFPVTALKTGLLGTPEIVRAVEKQLSSFEGSMVVDPVLVASTGDRLAEGETFAEALQSLIEARATIVTPNRDETEAFLGQPLRDAGDGPDAALALSKRWNTAVLVKGGHFDGTEARDWLAHDGEVEEIREERLPEVSYHGSGCTYSAAIAANLARGHSLIEAVTAARAYLQAAMREAVQWETAHGQRGIGLAHFPSGMQCISP